MSHFEQTRDSGPDLATAQGQELAGPATTLQGPPLRQAVVFAWFVPPGLESLGEYYLALLAQCHADSRLFIGMNHGSDPAWAARFAASGLDVVVRWARAGSGDYWDATGFLTALEAFQVCDEAFSLVWFGHTKGGSRAFDSYTWVREDHRRDFWARREEIAAIFADPGIGFYAPRYNLTPPYPFPGPWPGWRDELAALCRSYRADFAPLGLCALDTVYVLRGEIVRRFCREVAPRFFATDLGALGANKWFFEMAFPSIASMQGCEPFIPVDPAGEGDPRDDLMLYRDTAQVHRLARAEVARWRADRTGFQPRILAWDLPAWTPPAPEPDPPPQPTETAPEPAAAPEARAAVNDIAATHSAAHRLEHQGWVSGPGTSTMTAQPEATRHELRVVSVEPVPHAFRVRLTLTAQGMELLHLRVWSGGEETLRARDIWLDIARPGALHHGLERVALHVDPARHLFQLEMDGELATGETLREVAITPASADLVDVPVTAGMEIGLPQIAVQQLPGVLRGARFLPERFPEQPPLRPQGGKRHAVVFAWFVPAHLPDLGEYYLNLLRYYLPDAKLFIGMNHGSDPAWETRFRASGLDVEVRWARPELGDYWDTTGFITALEGFHDSDEAFDLVWFGHTKGASGATHTDFDQHRTEVQRNFWARRSEIETIFANPDIGLFARRLTPWWEGICGNELLALQRVYREECSPLGASAVDTFYVLRAAIVRRFCDVADDAFWTDPGHFGANRWFFEMAFPSIASMQGFQPYVDHNVGGADDPRRDVWLRHDPRQNHRLVGEELARWVADGHGFAPRRLREFPDPWWMTPELGISWPTS